MRSAFFMQNTFKHFYGELCYVCKQFIVHNYGSKRFAKDILEGFESFPKNL